MQAAAAATAEASAPSGSSSSSPSSTPSSSNASSSAAAAASVTGYYVLKTGEHLGQGLQVVPSSKALSTLLERNKPYLSPPGQQQQQGQQPAAVQPPYRGSSKSSSSKSSSSSTTSVSAAAAAAAGVPPPPRPFICVQQYITNPLLVQGRKFGLRLWVLALGPKPFRAYLYREGLVLFCKEQYNADMEAVQLHGAAAQVGVSKGRQNSQTHVAFCESTSQYSFQL
jgi:hypothetical protein